MMWMGLKREKQPYFYIAMGWIGLRYIQTRINYMSMGIEMMHQQQT